MFPLIDAIVVDPDDVEVCWRPSDFGHGTTGQDVPRFADKVLVEVVRLLREPGCVSRRYHAHERIAVDESGDRIHFADGIDARDGGTGEPMLQLRATADLVRCEDSDLAAGPGKEAYLVDGRVESRRRTASGLTLSPL